MFTERVKIEKSDDIDKLVALKEENKTLLYTVMRKKDGTEAAATGGLTIASVKIGEYTATIHNDVTLAGLKALKVFMEKGEIPEQHITKTKTGKGLVLNVLLKDGGRHNTYIYLRKGGSTGNSRSNITLDDIAL